MDPLLRDLEIDSLVPLGVDDVFLPLDDADAKLLDCQDDFLLPDFDFGAAEPPSRPSQPSQPSQLSPESAVTQLRVVNESPSSGGVERVQTSVVTPATSESWNDKNGAEPGYDGHLDSNGQYGQYGQYGQHGSGSSRLTPPGSSGPSDAFKWSEEEEKRQLRMKKNRENAHLSRVRKKQQMENLETACRSLAKQNADLNVLLQRLTAENFLLRDHLKEACERAKIEVPVVPNVLEEVSAGTDVEGGNGHGGDVGNRPWVETGLDAAPGSSTVGLRSTRTAAKRKRGGVSSGATAAFLALFSLFLFASPTAFVGERGVAPSGSAVAGLPDVTSVATGMIRSGRGLMASEEDIGGTDVLSVSDYFSQTVEALLEDQAELELPKLALSVVEDMAQSALALDFDRSADESQDGKDSVHNPVSGHLLPASTVFPALADRFFSSSGLEAPQMCRKIFDFSADDVPAVSPSSKKSIENYVLGTTVGFKGRASGLKIQDEAIEPINTVTFRKNRGDDDGEAGTAEEGDEKRNLPAPVQEPSLVSVLLPANASTNPSGPGITAIDELYVVILNPQNTFSTYACQLPNKRALVV